LGDAENDHYILDTNKKYIIKFMLTTFYNTLNCHISCSNKIDFTQGDSIGSLLGFNKRILGANKLHESDQL